MLEGFETTEFLSNIDTPLNDSQRNALIAQVRAEISESQRASLHPHVQIAYEPKFSPAITAEHKRLSEKREKKAGEGIDVSRYEALEAPERTSPHSDEEKPELLRQWRETLQKAYTTNTYLSGRLTNLSLLETYGRNAWLIGNSQLEAILKDLEVEFKASKVQLEAVEDERRRTQETVKAEMETLEASWKKGIRGIIEVELATGDLRRQTLAKRRQAAGY